MAAAPPASGAQYGENASGQYDYNAISGDPSLATNWYPTEQAAQAAWFGANPQYGKDPSGVYGSPNSSAAPVSTPAAAATPSNSNTTASGLPTAAAVASDAPLPISAFGATPAVTPTLVNPDTAYGQEQTAYSQNAAALAPQFAQQQSQLQDSNAARGISSSGAAGYLQGNLSGQQAGVLAGADAGVTSQGMAYNQADVQSNQAASNQATNTNAAYYGDVLSADAGQYNGYLNQLEQQGYNTGNEAYGTYLNSFAPSSLVGSTISGAQNAGTSGYNNAYGAATSNENALLGAAGAGLGNYFGNIGAGSNGSNSDTAVPWEDSPNIL